MSCCRSRRPPASRDAQAVFERCPAEPPNRVVRYMAQQLGWPAVRFRGRCQQQGLLHLFKTDLRRAGV